MAKRTMKIVVTVVGSNMPESFERAVSKG
jgi:hypothetical protein